MVNITIQPVNIALVNPVRQAYTESKYIVIKGALLMKRWLPLSIAVLFSIVVTLLSFMFLKDRPVNEILSILSSLFILSAAIYYIIVKVQK